jgi:hypothetical protein
VRLVNLDNAVLIGPGSEWFWSAASGLVLAVTLIALYRQLRLQRSADAVALTTALGREWFGEHLTRHQFAVLSALKTGVAPAAVPGGSAIEILNFWERIGFLARGGHVDARLVWDVFGGQALLWWIYLKPIVMLFRKEQGDPEIGEHFEWLAARVRQLQDAAGGVSPTDDLARQLIAAAVTRLSQRIAIFDQERGVNGRSGPTDT